MNRSALSSRKKRILTIAAVVAVLLAVAGGLSAWRAGNAENAPEAGSIEAVAEKLAKEQAQARNELNTQLVAAAEVAHGHLMQVLQGLASVKPAYETLDSNPARMSDEDEWNRGLTLATSALEAVEDGTSEQTVTREAFMGAAELLRSAVAAHEQLLRASPDQLDAIAEIVAERRDAAVRLWQAGAAQLDTLTVGSGEGHVHVFLAQDGDPDAVPEEFREPRSQE